jgi:hypothetical protein
VCGDARRGAGLCWFPKRQSAAPTALGAKKAPSANLYRASGALDGKSARNEVCATEGSKEWAEDWRSCEAQTAN